MTTAHNDPKIAAALSDLADYEEAERIHKRIRTQARLVPRPESPMMRTLRQLDYDAHLRPADFLALALGYACILAGVVVLAIWVVDTMQGRPNEVLPQLQAFLAWLEGAPR